MVGVEIACRAAEFGRDGDGFQLVDLPVEPFDDADDFELVDAGRGIEGDLDEGRFALFVAYEPHMPTLCYPSDGAVPIKKICFKLIADEYFDE